MEGERVKMLGSDAFLESFVAASALLGEADAVRAAERDVALAAALARAPSRPARAALLAEAVARAARELQQARIA